MPEYISQNNSLKLLILCQDQFGYHIDTFFYCKYLRNYHEVTYLCWDYGKPKQKMDNVQVHYIPRVGNIVIRNIRYLFYAARYFHHNLIDICFIKYFRGCVVLRLLFPKTKMIFDIRSGSTNKNTLLRFLYDAGMHFESIFFKNVTIISRSLAEKLHLAKKGLILPIGSAHISSTVKSFEEVKLLYVGTLSNRHIERTIIGISCFLKKAPKNINLLYTVIGDGYYGEVEYLRTLVKELKLSSRVKIVGRIPFTQLTKYFDNHNTGVSFVPITPFFDVQPVTKTFDYLLSGMPVIGTATTENKNVINDENGVLVDDTVEGFAKGLERLLAIKLQFSSEKIMQDSKKYHWELIVNNLDSYLLSVVNHGK
ncbi:MAG: glycosyltransferase [Thermodesulfobacteriota bacterium]